MCRRTCVRRCLCVCAHVLAQARVHLCVCVEVLFCVCTGLWVSTHLCVYTQMPLCLCTHMCVQRSIHMYCVCTGSRPCSPPANTPGLFPPGSQPISPISPESEPRFSPLISTSSLWLGTSGYLLGATVSLCWHGGGRGMCSKCRLYVCLLCGPASPALPRGHMW